MYLLHTITGVTDAQKLNQGPKGPSSLVTCGFNECIRVSLFSVAKLESITSYEPPELNCVRLCQLSSRVRIARSAISLLKVYDHLFLQAPLYFLILNTIHAILLLISGT